MATGIENHLLAWKCEQDVIAAQWCAVGRAFQKERISRRIRLEEWQKILGIEFPDAAVGAGSGKIGRREPVIEAGNLLVRRQSTARNTSVPFVPPKPNELDSAVWIFDSRASFGT